MFKYKNELIASFFILIQIVIIILNKNIDANLFIWFCNHSPTLFAIGFLTKNQQLTKAIINIGLIPQLLWTLDLFSKLFFDTYLLGITPYFFEELFGLRTLYPILTHIISPIVAIYFTYKIKPTLKSIYYSIAYAIILFSLTLTLTTRKTDINCIYNACGLVTIDPITNIILWLPLIIILVIIPGYWIQKKLS